jgi:hypothetical protein
MADSRVAKLKAQCAARGYTFAPWSPAPWEVDGEAPPAWAAGTAWSREWPRVWKLRQRLEAKLLEPDDDQA